MFQPAKSTTGRVLLLAALCTAAFSFTGCEKKEDKPQASTPRPPRATQPAQADADEDDYGDDSRPNSRGPGLAMGMTLDDLRFEMDLDRRVSVDPQQSIEDQAMAESALRFCEAYVRGDSQAFSKMLMQEDRATLESLVADGLWQAETASINEVALLRMTPLGMGYLLTVGIDGSSVVTQEWAAQSSGDGFQFAARTGSVNYGATRSLEQLKREFYEGVTDTPLEEDGEIDPDAFIEMVLQASQDAAAEAGEEDEEEEPYERPSMNPRDHIKKKFYPGG